MKQAQALTANYTLVFHKVNLDAVYGKEKAVPAVSATQILGAVDFSSIEKVFFQHQELFQHPKGVFSAPGVFSASTVFYQHLRCFSSTQKIVFL